MEEKKCPKCEGKMIQFDGVNYQCQNIDCAKVEWTGPQKDKMMGSMNDKTKTVQKG